MSDMAKNIERHQGYPLSTYAISEINRIQAELLELGRERDELRKALTDHVGSGFGGICAKCGFRYHEHNGHIVPCPLCQLTAAREELAAAKTSAEYWHKRTKEQMARALEDRTAYEKQLVTVKGRAMKWEAIANLPEPSHPGSCTLGITDCDGVCMDRGNVFNTTDEEWRALAGKVE